MKKMLICLFAAVLAVSMMGCKGEVGSGSGEGGGSGYIGSKAPDEAKAVGDIVFTDGSATPYAAGLTLTDNQKSKSIAVIYKVDGDKVYGVGLIYNKNNVAWCLQSANGYDVTFVDIQCIPNGIDGDYSFTGDTDGSDNFRKIAQTLGDDDDTEIEGNYPAFEFANNYKNQENSHVSGTAYEKGWYLPSIAELFDIWKVKEIVDTASGLCEGSQFGNQVSLYWSSSVLPGCFDPLVIHFGGSLDGRCDSGLYYGVKGEDGYVCCIRVF